MRYLILSDMHGNWEALRSVLRKVRRKRFDRTLVLGDLVGYGAAPNQVVDAIRSLQGPVDSVRGNHDKVVAGIDAGSAFNEIALAAARWTHDRLTPENLRYLCELPQGPLMVENEEDPARGVAICHGSPADEDEYVFSDREANSGFAAEPHAEVTFFGHTHLPSIFVHNGRSVRGALLRGDGEMTLAEDFRYLLNPGSIGQPRDRNPLAAFMTYDSENRTLRWRRVRYSIVRAQKRILAAGLPEPLAERLELGV